MEAVVSLEGIDGVGGVAREPAAAEWKDVQIEQEAFHRYFRLRCRRCASAGTPRATPRSIRSTGV